MKVVKTLALVASTIGFANVGLSLPAHSQQVASNQATQTAIVIGNNNTVNQTNILVIKNRGRFNGNSRFPSTTSTTQAAEIQGNVKSQISELGAIIMHTPGIDTDSTKVTFGRVTIDRNRRRNRTPSTRRRQVIPSAAILRQRAIDKIKAVEAPNRVGTSTTRTSTNDSSTVSEQNIQCSGSGSSVVQSSQTINGRTVSSETRTNCN